MAEESISTNVGNCYVYHIIVDDVIRYVGKGSRGRAKVHVTIARNLNVARALGQKVRASSFYNKLACALTEGAAIRHEIIVEGLSAESAYEYEVKGIAALPASQLWNETPGGDGFRIEDLQNPEAYRAKLKAGVNASWSNIDRHVRASAKAQERWSDPKAREKQSVTIRNAWASPMLRKRNAELFSARLEGTAHQKEAALARWSRPGERERQADKTRADQAFRNARKRANVFCCVLSFGA